MLVFRCAFLWKPSRRQLMSSRQISDRFTHWRKFKDMLSFCPRLSYFILQWQKIERSHFLLYFKRDRFFWLPFLPAILGATGSWFLKQPIHAYLADNPVLTALVGAILPSLSIISDFDWMNYAIICFLTCVSRYFGLFSLKVTNSTSSEIDPREDATLSRVWVVFF